MGCKDSSRDGRDEGRKKKKDREALTTPKELEEKKAEEKKEERMVVRPNAFAPKDVELVSAYLACPQPNLIRISPSK